MDQSITEATYHRWYFPAAVLVVRTNNIQALLAQWSDSHPPMGRGACLGPDPTLEEGYVGSAPVQASDIVREGGCYRGYLNAKWPMAIDANSSSGVEGALVALNPENGALLALVGGFDYGAQSSFNRVTQAEP